MDVDLTQQRKQVHALIARIPSAKPGVVRNLLQNMIEEDDAGELTERDRTAIQAGLASLKQNGGVPTEDVLSGFGLTATGFEKMVAEPDTSRSLT